LNIPLVSYVPRERERHYRSRPKSLSINGLFCKIGPPLLAG